MKRHKTLITIVLAAISMFAFGGICHVCGKNNGYIEVNGKFVCVDHYNTTKVKSNATTTKPKNKTKPIKNNVATDEEKIQKYAVSLSTPSYILIDNMLHPGNIANPFISTIGMPVKVEQIYVNLHDICKGKLNYRVLLFISDVYGELGVIPFYIKKTTNIGKRIYNNGFAMLKDFKDKGGVSLTRNKMILDRYCPIIPNPISYVILKTKDVEELPKINDIMSFCVKSINEATIYFMDDSISDNIQLFDDITFNYESLKTGSLKILVNNHFISSYQTKYDILHLNNTNIITNDGEIDRLISEKLALFPISKLCTNNAVDINKFNSDFGEMISTMVEIEMSNYYNYTYRDKEDFYQSYSIKFTNYKRGHVYLKKGSFVYCELEKLFKNTRKSPIKIMATLKHSIFEFLAKKQDKSYTLEHYHMLNFRYVD